MNNQQQQQGFTLIELAIVLFVVGLLLGGFLAPLANKIEFENRVETQVALEEIKDILLGFAIETGYLPCPDTDATDSNFDGEEDTVTPASGVPGLTCETEIGRLPFVTLGINGDDAWDNAYIYRVDDDFADRDDSPNTDGTDENTASPPECATTAGVSFSLCSKGNISVLDGNGGNTIANEIPALIVSEGQNFTETPSTHEAENSDGDGIFVQRGYSADDTNTFDDITIWISPHILRNRMVEAGVLP